MVQIPGMGEVSNRKLLLGTLALGAAATGVAVAYVGPSVAFGKICSILPTCTQQLALGAAANGASSSAAAATATAVPAAAAPTATVASSTLAATTTVASATVVPAAAASPAPVAAALSTSQALSTASLLQGFSLAKPVGNVVVWAQQATPTVSYVCGRVFGTEAFKHCANLLMSAVKV